MTIFEALKSYTNEEKIGTASLAKILKIPRTTVWGWLHKDIQPTKKHLERIREVIPSLADNPSVTATAKTALSPPVNDCIEKTNEIKRLLLLLEKELRLFRSGTKEMRDIFRGQLDPYDVSYISSLLIMLGEEEKFERWRALNTNQFRFFKGKEAENEDSGD